MIIISIILISITLILLFVLYLFIRILRRRYNENNDLLIELSTEIDILEHKRCDVVNLIAFTSKEILLIYNRKCQEAYYNGNPVIWKEIDYYREKLENLNFKYFCLTGQDVIKFADSLKKGVLIQNLN